MIARGRTQWMQAPFVSRGDLMLTLPEPYLDDWREGRIEVYRAGKYVQAIETTVGDDGDLQLAAGEQEYWTTREWWEIVELLRDAGDTGGLY